MRRGLLIVAVTCVLLSLGLAAVGMRTFYRVDELEYVSRHGWGGVLIPKNGRLDVLYFQTAGYKMSPGFSRIHGSAYSIGGTDYGRRVFGFGGGIAPSAAKYVNIPFWFLATVFAVPPGLVIRREVRRRARDPGQCRSCGYDVRATPARCPECGAEPQMA